MRVLFSIINADVSRSKRHKHECFELVYRIDGDSRTTIDGAIYDISRGDMYILPPKTFHFDCSEGLFTDLVIQAESLDFDEPFVFHDDEGCIEALSFMINKIINKKEDNYQSIANSLADAMILDAKRFLCPENRDPTVEDLKNTIFENIENSDFDISTEIKKTGYNTDYMRRCFKAQTQTTPNNYLTELRIERAKQLLLTNSYESIESISSKCGFRDPFYFSTCFKKHTGLSPLRYRKLNLSVDL